MPPRYGGYDKKGLVYFTNGFSQDNVITKFHLGTVYRGVNAINKKLVVKVWDKDHVDGCPVWREHKDARMRDESCLTWDDSIQFHPNMIKISGIVWSEFTPSMVYEIDALDTLNNLLHKDSLSWVHRVKVALGIASLLQCMHGSKPFPYLIRNISAAHIILDQDHNAKLYDFSMISGGILADKTELLNQHLHGCYGYIDPDFVSHGRWSKKCDVFSLGVVLIGLISKRVQPEMNPQTNHEPFLYQWAHREYQMSSPGTKSLVHNSLEAQPFFCTEDGIALTKLAMQCVDFSPKKRPTMKQVFSGIQKLLVAQKNTEILSHGKKEDVPRFSISELHGSMIKNLKVTLDLKEKGLKTMIKYLASKEKMVSGCKDWKYVAPHRLSYEDIRSYTFGFSEDNFINIYPFGKLYHGCIDSRKVTVKTWEDVDTHVLHPGDNEIRLREELLILQYPKFVSHPNIVKMIGYCYENEKLSAVYDLESMNILLNLVSKDSFTWHKRIILILEFAELLQYLQQRNPPYLTYVLRNISGHTILVDRHYKPKLFDFGMLLGGILKDQEDYRIPHVHHWDYYTDPHTNCYDCYTDDSDIYSFGMIILNLITKICYLPDSEPGYEDWVRNEFKRAKLKDFSMVNDKFRNEVDFDMGDGQRVTKLAMQCIHVDYWKRPKINQVVKRLKNLKIVRNCSS